MSSLVFHSHKFSGNPLYGDVIPLLANASHQPAGVNFKCLRQPSDVNDAHVSFTAFYSTDIRAVQS